jgi:hypothetical protein
LLEVSIGAGGNKEKPQSERDKAQGRCIVRRDKKRCGRLLQRTNVYLWKDPKGPLAPEEGQRPYSSMYRRTKAYLALSSTSSE